jgi:hypothetical protein
MPIVPNGKKRIMEAQYPPGQGDQWGTDFLGSSGDFPSDQQGGSSVDMDIEQPAEQINLEETPEASQEGDTSVNEFIYKKLESFGYPPRRIEEFSDEFIEEKIYPGGVKDVTIVLPDRYYGKKKPISDPDLTQIVSEIQTQFGLTMTDALRKEKKVTLNFTSQPSSPEDEEDQMMGDDLDEIFGGKGPGKTKKRTKDKSRLAQTITEIIEASRSGLLVKLAKLSEEKKND